MSVVREPSSQPCIDLAMTLVLSAFVANDNDIKPKPPHDPFVKFVFQDPKRAAAELRTLLPAALVARIDWPTLRLENDSYVDAELAQSFGDRLFSVEDVTGRKLHIYVLFEHQSTSSPDMCVRALGYKVQIWQRQLRTSKRDRITPIIPVVLCHAEGGWQHAGSLRDMLDTSPETFELLRDYIPDFRLLIDDLAQLDDSALLARPASPAVLVALWLLRDARRPQRLLNSAPRWAHQIAELLDSAEGIDLWRVYIEYAGRAGGENGVSLEDLANAIVSAQPSLRETIMDGVERLLEKGRAQGRAEGEAKGKAEGRAEGKAEMLLVLLAAKFGEVTDAHRERVRTMSTEQLDDATVRILTADSTDAVIGR